MQVYKAIKYIRLSYTDDKTVESDSVANQRRLIDDYIARHPEIEVVAEKIDDGYSGVLFDRPAFQEMMRMIEQGEANCVIVKDLSRLPFHFRQPAIHQPYRTMKTAAGS